MNNIKPAIWFLAIKTNTGTDRFTEQLASSLQERGFKAEITWLPHHAEYLPWLVSIPQKPNWANIVHINTWLHPRFLPNKLAVVATLHHCVQDQSFSTYKTFLQKIYHLFWITPIEKHSLKTANAITTVSQYTAQCAKKIFNINNIHVIYNGINNDIFHSDELKTFINQAQPFKILFVGTNSIRKGFDLLPKIMQQLGEDFQLFYTSNAEQYEPLPSNMTQLPCQKTAQDLVNTYRAMDALIFPSRLEGFGLVVAEAMSCGLPVVIADSSALTELVNHGVTGLLCPQDDVNAFAKTIRQLAADPELQRKLSQNAREHAKQFFRLDLMVEHYIDVYNKVLSTP